MKLRRNSGTRNVRRQLLLQLIAVASLSGGHVMAADGYDNILVTAAVQDCSPPVVQASPCPPGGVIIHGEQPTVAPAPTTSEEPTVEGQEPSVQGQGLDPMANAPMSASEPSDTSPTDTGVQNNAPLTANAAANTFAASSATSLASTSGSGGGLDAPNMLGDLPGVSTGYRSSGGSYNFSDPAASIRRFKISENVSPLPQDRVYFNYNHFDDAVDVANGGKTYLDRYTFGGEKTFLDGLFSFEFRLAVSDGLDSKQSGSAAAVRGTEFGNLQMALKSLLYSSNSCAVGGGLTLSVPTADDIEIDGVGSIENDIVYIAPFIGFINMPSENTFIQGFSQVDVGLGGNSVLNGTGNEVGVLQDLTLMYNSISAGYWLHRDNSSNAICNGLAVMSELHYTTALDDGDSIGLGGGDALSTPGSVDSLNTTLGFVVRKGLTNIRTAYSVALDGDNRLYDSELLIQVNRQF